jgi:4-aminobutyrate aminotransferase/(S)-3-amino-2-methylpropionate transaminase
VKTYIPTFVASAGGARVEDIRGRSLIDFTGGIGVTGGGHASARIVKAVQEQAARYLHICYSVAYYEPYVRMAEKLAGIMPPGLTKSAFFNSGAEAVENAVKFAKAYTKRQGVITFQNSFHGRTHLTMAMTGKVDPYKRHYFAHVPGVYHAPFPYPYRSPRGNSPTALAQECLGALETLFRSTIPADQVAAIVLEPIQGEGGFIVPPAEWLKGIRSICDEHGIVMVADEVQSGLGRTGRWFAIDHFGVEPDLVTTAKPLGGGLPLSGVTGRPEVMDAPPPGAIGGTFGGSPLSCVAGLEHLEVLERALPRVPGIERTVRRGFEEIAQETGMVGEVRGKGAMMAMELVKDLRSKEPATKEAKAIVHEAFERGLMVITAGLYDNVVRVLPPLTIPQEDLEEGLSILRAAAKSAAGAK